MHCSLLSCFHILTSMCSPCALLSHFPSFILLTFHSFTLSSFQNFAPRFSPCALHNLPFYALIPSHDQTFTLSYFHTKVFSMYTFVTCSLFFTFTLSLLHIFTLSLQGVLHVHGQLLRLPLLPHLRQGPPHGD